MDPCFSFTFKGRSSRSSIWLGQFLLNVCVVILDSKFYSSLLNAMSACVCDGELEVKIFYYIGSFGPAIAFIWLWIALTVRRIHDLDSSVRLHFGVIIAAVLYVLLCVFIFGHFNLSNITSVIILAVGAFPTIYFEFKLFFRRGTVGPNKYGDDPVITPPPPPPKQIRKFE
ncbi:MAG: hypothetical protein A2007_00625 [Verrucomicrobia bacterium GWC2_42_7]|nr:MAG: hypothetical protein A2007_00625 [Verrucomicrobia bacterium GWC2_42_7]